ncbi:class I SAM-dependent RNA methyltransferase, partial [Mongoliimonas terrestris]|uniref:class I SAM-dependent RNA methyltransferase n=1 Tax=Mongoliimonas terrestris TaxID=1709001 RepID=UPI001115387B
MIELEIDRLGHRGDGVATVNGRAVFVPYALPGERVRATLAGDRADEVEILTRSPDRADPPCPHFGICGGCLVQHLAPGPYADFKRQLVVDALADRGLTPPVEPTRTSPPNARRRATFAGILLGRQAVVGFHQRASHAVVDIDVCFVVTPTLLKAKPALQALVSLIQPRKQPIDLTVTESVAGPDIAVGKLPAKDLERLRLPLIQLAERFDLPRLSVGNEVIVERRPPVVRIDGIAVVPPP